jgi:hypothetical protein
MRLAASLSGAPVSSSYRASATSCFETIAASRVADPCNSTHNATTSTPTPSVRRPIAQGVGADTECDDGRGATSPPARKPWYSLSGICLITCTSRREEAGGWTDSNERGPLAGGLTSRAAR